MPTFTLNTAFTQDDLTRFLASGSNVVVAKPNAGGRPNVAWVVYRPLLENNMTWEEQYGIYASNTLLTQSGAVITQISKTSFPAADGKLYGLSSAGFFGPPSSGGTPGSFSAINEYNNLPSGLLTFGLYQNATVNGSESLGNAVSAAPVPYRSTAVMTPFTTVYLWIQSQVASSSVLTTVTSPMTKVTFGGSITDVSLSYDAESGTFIPGGRTALPEGISVHHDIPELY